MGLESAKRLALAGATVVLTARTAAKGDRAKEQVLQYLKEKGGEANNNNNNSNRIQYVTLDLDQFDSIRSFPKRYQHLKLGKIDVLMNNAGLEIDTRQVTNDGFERTFQSNHLGPFLLTAVLFPYLRHDTNNGSGARVINVASTAHQFALKASDNKPGLDFNNLNGDLYKSWNNGWSAYGASKLENILFTQELQRRADGAGLDWLTTASLHPGVVGTDIWRNTPLVGKSQQSQTVGEQSQSFLSSLFYKSALTTEEGANTQIWLASVGAANPNTGSNTIVKGAYYDEHGQIKPLDRFAQDPIQAKELWDVSETLVGVQFKLK